MERSTSAQTKDEQQLYQLAALSLSEQSRARATLDLIAQTGSNTDTRLHPEQAAQRDALYEELIAAQYARDRLIDGVTGLEVLDQAANRLSDARSAIAVFESDLQAGLQQGMGISSSRILHAESMSAVIDDDAALLQYFLGEFGSFLWVVTQESIDVFELPPEAEISRLAKSLHDMLSMPARARTGSTDKTSSQLAATIIEPALPLIGNRRLILVAADAGLQYLPFSTLPIGDGDRVVDKFEVAVIPSLSLMEMHRTIHADRPRPQNTLVALGDPIFSANDPRLPDMIPADDRSASALPRLVFSGDEVESIAAMIPPGQATVRVAAAANRQFVLDGGLASYQYVHLATHGLVDSAQPALSRLVLSQFDALGNAVEGRLYLHEIYRLLLYSDVVVLSACDTAMGRDIRGEGLIGFTQAFLYAGSRSVIASLWPVRDRPTKELMTRFYANLLHKQLNPTEALRSAKRELSSDRRWSDPHYWAGFVFQGDWSTDKNN
jgi:CHAT domain-containing protein